MTCNLYQLTRDLTAALDDNREDILSSVFPEDLLHEYVDSIIPVYYVDLADCLSADISLGQVDDPSWLPEGATVWQIIAVAISEQLSAAAYEWLEDNAPNAAAA